MDFRDRTANAALAANSMADHKIVRGNRGKAAAGAVSVVEVLPSLLLTERRRSPLQGSSLIAFRAPRARPKRPSPWPTRPSPVTATAGKLILSAEASLHSARPGPLGQTLRLPTERRTCTRRFAPRLHLICCARTNKSAGGA
jgi:hypothetical protein